MDIQAEKILAYIDDRLSNTEKDEFEKQLSSSESLRKLLAEMRFISEASSILYHNDKIDVDKRWRNISSNIKRKKHLQLIGRITRKIAAILIIPLVISIIYLYDKTVKLENIPIELIEQTSAYGLISKIQLPDKSEVWLNSGSTLQYPERFTDDTRKVYLTGEGYFKVSSDKEHRFDVALSNGVTVSAFGTEFNVNSYEDDKNIHIALAEGSVEVNDEVHSVSQLLSPGEQASFNKETKNTEVAKANIYQITSWKDGKMVFRRSAMIDVCKKLSRHFNVDIKLQNKEIYDYKYSATFTTETLEEILTLLEKTAPIKCRMAEPAQINDYAYTKRRVVIESR